MTGTVKLTLRNPLDKSQTLDYYIEAFDNPLARDWLLALKQLLISGNQLEKNYCFMGFPETARNLDYLCQQLNRHVQQINLFNCSGRWQTSGLKSYIIEEYFTPDVVRFGSEYPVGYDDRSPGLGIKHDVMNRLHNHFERLQGTAWDLSLYYKLADYQTKYAIRQLNNICHEIETLVLSQRKLATAPDWVRPSQITTFLQAPRYELKQEHRRLFRDNGYDRRFGWVYMHWTQIGKTLFEVFRDEGAPALDHTVCETITELRYYSGEFDIEWGNDVIYGQGQWWHDQEQDKFRQWLLSNKLDPNSVNLSLGYLPIGAVDLKRSFGTVDPVEIRSQLSRHLDILAIEVLGVAKKFDYCWTDSDYENQQIEKMIPGYDYSSKQENSSELD